MTNVRNFNVESILDGASKAAPFIAMITAMGAFSLVGVFKADYYTGVLSERWVSWSIVAGICIALVTELSRAVLLLMSFKDFREGKITAGVWGMFLSIGLVIYDCIAAGPISSLWTNEAATNLSAIIRDIVVFMVVLSFGIELRLSISGRQKAGKEKSTILTDNNSKQQTSLESFKMPHSGNNSNIENRSKIGFKLPAMSVATEDNIKVLQFALKGAKSYYSAYKNKPDTKNNKEKRAEYRAEVDRLQRMINNSKEA